MKKKFISAMLFGAVLLASSTAVVSCKDYDDDINSLREQITSTSTDLNSLLTKEIATATTSISELKTAQSSLESAYSAADDALKKQIETAANDANKYAETQAVQAQEAAIAAAQTLVNDAVTDLQAKIDAANKAIEDVNATVAKSATKEELEAVKQALLDADTELRTAITAAQTRADNAYTLAEQANKLATQNASDIKDLQKTVADNAAQAASDLKTVKDELEADIASIQKDLKDLTTKVGNVEKTANQNAIDIKTINAQLTALKTSDSLIIANLADSSKTMRALVAANKQDIESKLATAVKNTNDSINNAKLEAEAFSVLLVAATNSRIDSTNASIDKVIGAYTQADADIYKRIDAVKDSLAGVINTYKGDQSKKDAKQDSIIAQLQLAIQTVGNGDISKFATLVSGYGTSIDNLNTEVAKINKYLSVMDRHLKGLVFSPERYYYGIEAIGIDNFKYKPIELKYAFGAGKTGNDDKQNDDEPTYKKKNNAEYYENVVPFIEATYYLNPSNADIDTDKSRFSYIVNNATMTRSLTASNITVDSTKVSSGKLKVYFSIDDYSKIAQGTEGTTDNNIDVAALRYTYKTAANQDTTITSDFAALKTYDITDFYINKVTTEGAVDKSNELHLFEKAQDAVNDAATTDGKYIIIKYDNYQEGVDLNKWINVHYKMNGGGDQLWGGQTTINKKNFELKYELLGYCNQAGDVTNESGHATIKGSILTVHKANQPGVKAGKEIVGRRPLIRVTLWDNTKNEIAAVGYILAKIVADPKTYTVAIDPNTKDYQLVCAGDDAHTQTTTWQQIEEQLLAQVYTELGISKSDFELVYELAKTNSTINVYAKVDGDPVTTLGTVTETQYSGTQATHILSWTLKGEQAYKALKSADSVSIYVKYKRKDGSSEAPIWVKLTWTPAKKLESPEAIIKSGDNGDKVKADWHALSSNTQGWADVHMQIGAPTSTTTAQFNQLTLDNTFKTPTLPTAYTTAGYTTSGYNIKDIVIRDLYNAGYTKLATSSSLSVQYAFAPLAEQTKQSYSVKQADGSSKTYTITVASDNLSMSATVGSSTYQIATIDPDNGKVTLATNDIATALINNADFATDINDALTLTVKISAKTCNPATGVAATTINLHEEGESDAKFDVRVLKPLYLTGITAKNMKLNEGTSLEQNVTASFKDFVGYTPKTFMNVNTSGVQFYKFYDIQEYKLDMNKITTDYTGTTASIDPSRFTISFASLGVRTTTTTEDGITTITEDQSYDGNAVTNKYDANGQAIIGKIKLTQVNMSGANTFHVYVPVTVVTKSNGNLVATLTITVEASNGGQNN